MPPIALCYDAGNVMDFRQNCPDMVLKVLNSCGGQGVRRYRQNGESDFADEAAVEAFLQETARA